MGRSLFIMCIGESPPVPTSCSVGNCTSSLTFVWLRLNYHLSERSLLSGLLIFRPLSLFRRVNSLDLSSKLRANCEDCLTGFYLLWLAIDGLNRAEVEFCLFGALLEIGTALEAFYGAGNDSKVKFILL